MTLGCVDSQCQLGYLSYHLGNCYKGSLKQAKWKIAQGKAPQNAHRPFMYFPDVAAAKEPFALCPLGFTKTYYIRDLRCLSSDSPHLRSWGGAKMYNPLITQQVSLGIRFNNEATQHLIRTSSLEQMMFLLSRKFPRSQETVSDSPLSWEIITKVLGASIREPG